MVDAAGLESEPGDRVAPRVLGDGEHRVGHAQELGAAAKEGAGRVVALIPLGKHERDRVVERHDECCCRVEHVPHHDAVVGHCRLERRHHVIREATCSELSRECGFVPAHESRVGPAARELGRRGLIGVQRECRNGHAGVEERVGVGP